MKNATLKLSFLSLLAIVSIVSQADAKERFLNVIPSDYNGAIYCQQCHASPRFSESENNASLPYARTFSNLVDDHNLSMDDYRRLEQYDSDADGFSNGQEIYGGSDINSSASTPHRNIAPSNPLFFAVPAGNETITLSSAPAVLQTSMVNGQFNIGGTIGVTMTNLTGGASPNQTGSATFTFSSGGLQADAVVYAYDKNDTPTQLPITKKQPYDNGSGTVTIVDESAYDTFALTPYIAAAKAITLSSKTAAFDIYGSVSPYAQISPYAHISSTAQIDDYAIIDDYADIQGTAHVSSYAYVAPNSVVTSGVTIDPYVNVSGAVTANALIPAFVGTIKTRLAFVTSKPTVLAVNGGDGGEGGSSTGGGLHCMTSGLSTTAMMMLMLLGFGFLLRRQAVKNRV